MVPFTLYHYDFLYESLISDGFKTLIRIHACMLRHIYKFQQKSEHMFNSHNNTNIVSFFIYIHH